MIQYCETLEENLNSIQSNHIKEVLMINAFLKIQNIMKSLAEIEDVTPNLYKFVYKTGKKFHKVYFLEYQDANDYYGTKLVINLEVFTRSLIRKLTKFINLLLGKQ